jgi:hypothetical protein
MLLPVKHKFQQSFSYILVTVLFVDTTGVTIESYDLPQTEKLHHYVVLSKHGYV